MRVSVALVFFTCLFSINAFALVSGEIHYKWWKNPRIAQEMNLTQEQADSIENIFNSYKEQIIVYQKELNGKENELLNVLRKPECSKDEVMKITDDIEDVKATLTRIKVEMYLKIKNVLTAEQEEMLHQIKARYRGKGQGR